MKKNITKATIKSIIRNGGATIKCNGERVSMKSGYQVSKRDLLIISVTEFTKHILLQAIHELNGRSEYLGVWVDEGKVYIDISHRIATKREAMERGRELNQLTILRWADMECLAVN